MNELQIKKLKTAKEYATSRNGQCLSNEYIGATTKLQWKCDNPEHPVWNALFSTIARGSWCTKCGYERLSKFKTFKYGLEKAIKFANDKGGQCLSKEYIGAKYPLIWKCHDLNHKSWPAPYNSVLGAKKAWCPECKSETLREHFKNHNGLKEAQEHAISKGGECLSKEYINGRTKLQWKCNIPEHAIWEATHSKVLKSSNWCPQCQENRNIQEFRVRKILNYLFDTEFVKTRKLEWNKNPQTGNFLELDGYSEKLKVAFEYQGQQHYDNIFRKEQLAYDTQEIRDLLKRENCGNKGVKLITIHKIHKKHVNDYELILQNILSSIEESSIQLNKVINMEVIREIFKLSPKNKHTISFLKKAKDYAVSRGGECVSNEYVNLNTEMKWKCMNSVHSIWGKSFERIVSNKTWCPECLSKKRTFLTRDSKGLEKAKMVALGHNGKCLSDEYLGSNYKLKWKCNNSKHAEWEATYGSVVTGGSWCMLCYKESRLKAKKEQQDE